MTYGKTIRIRVKAIYKLLTTSSGILIQDCSSTYKHGKRELVVLSKLQLNCPYLQKFTFTQIY